MDLEIVAVCSPRLNARCAIKTPADLAQFPLLHKIGTPNLWAEWMANAGIGSTGSLHGHTYQNFAMVAQAAVAGLGIALLPRCDVENEIAAKELEVVADFVRTKTSIHLFLPEARAGSRAVQAFAAWLFAEAGTFNCAGPLRPQHKETPRRADARDGIQGGRRPRPRAEPRAAAQPAPPRRLG
jgi:LysR family glycine cleavage system transcriptional activator